MGYRLTSEVKFKREGMCTLATKLSGVTRNTRLLYQNIRGNQCGISQFLKLREQKQASGGH